MRQIINTNRRILPMLSLLASCLLCLISLSLILLWRTPHGSKPPISDAFGVEDAAFRCEQKSMHCGKFRIGQPAEHVFRIFNTSSEIKHILKVVPGCSCAKVVHFSKEVDPQTWGEVAIALDTTKTSGRRQSSILIVTDDPKRPHLTSSISCEVLPAIEIKPQNLQCVLQELTSAAPPQTIEVIGLYPNEKISLTNIQTSDPAISVTKKVIDDHKRFRLNVAINKDVPAGITQANLIIHFEGSVQKSIRFPVTITNEAKIKAEPSMLELFVDKDALQTAEFTVKVSDNSSLEVNKVELVGTALHAVTQPMTNNTVLVRLEDLRVTWSLGRKHICVYTNHGELRVPITVSRRTKQKNRLPEATVADSVSKI